MTGSRFLRRLASMAAAAAVAGSVALSGGGVAAASGGLDVPAGAAVTAVTSGPTGAVTGVTSGVGTAPLCPTPSITSVATGTGEQAAAVGTVVYVTGSSLTSTACSTALSLGGQQVAFSADSASKLQFDMPAADPGGAVVVTLTDILGDAVTSPGTHDFVALPVVDSLSSRRPTEGQALAAGGYGFRLAGLAGATADVSYCGAPAQPATIVSDSELALPGPAGYCNGPVTLTLDTPHLSVAIGAGAVTVAAQITSVSPSSGVAPGSEVTVTGSGFGPAGSATVGGAPAAVQSWSDGAVVVTVPSAATSGIMVLTRGDGTRAATVAVALAEAATGGAGSPAGGPGAASEGTPGVSGASSPGGSPGGPGASFPAGDAPLLAGPARLDLAGSPTALGGGATALGPASTVAPLGSASAGGDGGITVAPGDAAAVAIAEGATGYSSTPAATGPAAALPVAVSKAVALMAPRPLPLPWAVLGSVLLAVVAASYLVVLRRGGSGALLLPPVEAPPLFWRAAGALGAVLLVVAYIVTAVSVLMTVFTYWLPGAGGATLPGAELYKVTAVVLSVILTGIAARYLYYYYCWARSRHDFAHARPVDVVALSAKPIPYLKFQVTTRGGALAVVERTVAAVAAVADAHPWLAPKMSVEVVTESMDEAGYLPARFHDAPIEVSALCLPRKYRTPNGTGLKARALHYMVERRLEGWNRKPGRTFVVHLDEETLVTPEHTLVLVDYLAGDPRPLSQGPILYPMEWDKAPWLCRAMESLRPFGCSECARVMDNPPPPHLHGSNLVVDEDVENRIGWDFGTLDGEAYIAEDLLFGLRAFALLGRDGFGWHGATMLEQPPLSVYWAVQQRLRWVLGALQGWRAMGQRDDLRSMPAPDRARLRRAVGLRIATYALGFPVGFAGLFFLVHHPANQYAGLWLFLHHPTREALSVPLFGLWRLVITLAGVGWVLSYQIGLARNLRYQKIGLAGRIRQHLIILVMTPVTGMFETAGPFLALTRWLAGARQARWTPTPKQAGVPAHDGGRAFTTA